MKQVHTFSQFHKVNRFATSLLIAFLAATLVCAPSATALAANTEVATAIGTGVEYNDNVNQTRNGKTDIIYTVSPAVMAEYETESITSSLSYKGDYSYYSGGTREDEYTHDLAAEMTAKLYKEVLFLKLLDTYRSVYIDATRGEDSETDSTLDQTDQNTFTVSPYFELPIGKRSLVKTGYEYRNVKYTSGDTGVDKQSHSVFSDFSHELTETLLLTSSLSALRQDSEDNNGFERYKATGGFKYEYAEDSSIFASAGPTVTDYDNGNTSTDAFLSAGISHSYENYLFGATVVSDFTEDPESGTSIRTTDYGTSARLNEERYTAGLTLNYTVYENEGSPVETTRLRPAAFFQYNFTPRLSANAGASVDFHSYPDKYVQRFTGNTGLSYAFTESVTGSLTYIYKDVYSGTSDTENYTVNRILAQIQVEF